MPYTPSEWADGEAGGTPITAAALNKIEVGVAGATSAAETPLVADDIPTLPASKVGSGTLADARIPALAIAKITGLQTAIDGKQVAGSYAAATHTHTIAQVTGLQTAIDGKAATSHNHTVAQVTGLQAVLDDLETRVAALETPAG